MTSPDTDQRSGDKMIRCRLNRLRIDAGDRQGRKLTLHIVATEAGVSYGSVQRLAANKAEQVEFATLDRLCTYFGCTVGELLEKVSN